jgi:alanyl-tRNA synthetase
MTSAEVRQSFLDFFRSKEHTIVPSSSLMPGSPNLLFTNAGMNQFVPIFLGQRTPDVSSWPGAVPGRNTRAADTQKCIRAGGKHNDLEDVGLDTYHHTLFEMLGNWSFGDYFKREAIQWAWELVTEVWRFPRARLYATVYSPREMGAANRPEPRRGGISPGEPDKAQNDPSEFDQEAYDIWAEKFRSAGLDPAVHVLAGGKKDNFWMMGETGPCGPCSEIHVDLTAQGDTKGALVNKGAAECIEIWNLVFIQFNANPDGSFSSLPARHVDTGMGFERVAGIIQNTRNFTEFTGLVSNYETDIFRPLFDRIARLSGKRYTSTLPLSGSTGRTEQERIDVAFRVIADHVRTLSFAIADGILPGNTDRNYVLRRILRRAVRYGRTLGFQQPFFYKLVSVLADTMGHVFPEIRAKQDHVEEVIQREEQAFNRTLDRGIELFLEEVQSQPAELSGQFAFTLYDTYGFPLDLTQLMARERGLKVGEAEFNALMEQQRARARAAQKKQVIELSQVESASKTDFVGYEKLETPAKVLEVVEVKDKAAIVLDRSPFYAEMGGQVGDSGQLSEGGESWRVVNTLKAGESWLHVLEERGDGVQTPVVGSEAFLAVNRARREAIQRHHTVTHLLHWALHEVVSPDAVQKGSYVGPEKLTFDFSSQALTARQVAEVERLVNERILENAPVSWVEVKYDHIKARKDIMQFFGEKYGQWVRVVQVGGQPTALDGYSMELCGGTHVHATGEIGLFRLVAESAVASGIRRIEAVAGLEAYKRASGDLELLASIAGKVNSPAGELERKIESLLAQHKELEKQLRALQQKQADERARTLLEKAVEAAGAGSPRMIIEDLGTGDGDYLQAVADGLKGRFKGIVVLAGVANGAVALVGTVSPELTKRIQAGKIIQAIAPIVGGRGGGRPDNARGGGKNPGGIGQALEQARAFIQEKGAL